MDEPTWVRYGTIAWTDLTVEDAPQLRDFYQAVAGWAPSEVDMGGYRDYNMHPVSGGDPVAGICHARGSNARIPPVWLIYILVPDVQASVQACLERGGAVVDGPRPLGSMGRFAVIRDPVGAAVALFEPTSTS